MSASSREERCAGIRRCVDAYLDGEFADHERGELDAHIATCEACRAVVRDQADWRAEFKRAAPREAVPAELMARIRGQIDAESHPELSWRKWAVRVLPLAAAAGLVLSLAGQRFFAGSALSPVIADAISKHQRNLPLEVTGGSDQVRNWYAGKVDFPVRPPQFSHALHAHSVALIGGRLANIRDRQAAYLRYEVDGNRVSVFIFDPGDMPISAPRKQKIGNREVFLDVERGYNVALYQDRGVSYAVTSELGEDQLIQLVSSAIESR